MTVTRTRVRGNDALLLHPKVAGGGLSGAVALIGVWVLGHWVVVPAEVAGAFTLVLSVAGGWLAPRLDSE